MARKHITDQQVCEAHFYLMALNFPVWPYELLAQRTGQPEKVCFRAMERAARHGLLEYGVSLRTAWLTDKGKQLLFDSHQRE